MELFEVKTTDEMKALMEHYFSDYQLETETVPLEGALGRVLSAPVVSGVNVPHFDRSVVDGYAVKLRDVQGASESIPAFLKLTGAAAMGRETTLSLHTGEAVYVPTGGMVPAGTEAMVMIEYTERFGEDELAVYKGAGSLENMMLTGDDIRAGARVFEAGHTIRPQDVGVLSSVGVVEVPVYTKPRITIISTGDEIIRPGQTPGPGQIVDINTPAIAALSEKLGAEAAGVAYAADDPQAIEDAIVRGLEQSDAVVLSGGSSVGERDYTLAVLKKLGEVFLHGLSIKPGKPTIMGRAMGKPVIGLPGQPASAIMVYMVVMKKLMNIFHKTDLYKNQYIVGTLTENVHAAPGRRTFQTVAVETGEDGVRVKPTYGKSGMITLLAYSDGYIEMTENEEGKNPGDSVKVMLF
ncbi:gephyrin-like molybdotransferase Glp [Eubacterium maltosivorans]|uniref:Molybdopterin molybdenumtransferase n=1 Tax=Eubacterium maltosivorans TaxID=2041044 RepID=A0A4P9C5D8_EUBML|nr:gephyrin-like molybdotransferase Glp [Eubacterium maltosivorans]QCT69851.1 molybdopterin molybdenumtransferase MoeA [Eubacterium maltosivorans]